MLAFIVRRVIGAIIAMFFVTFASFLLLNISPIDPAVVAIYVRELPVVTEETIAAMREDLGLNDPFFVRYWRWLVSIFTLDLGTSWNNQTRLITEELRRAFPYTATLSAVGLLFTLLLAVPLGILSAIFKDSLVEKVTRVLFFAGSSIPNYFLALLLIWLFSVHLRWLPSGGVGTFGHYVLPGISLAMVYSVSLARLLRNNILDNMKESYVLYGRARGLSETSLICKHVFKNSLQSTMTAVGFAIVGLLSGTVVIESIFSIPGLGRLSISAIFNRDFPMIQAYVLIVGFLFVFVNLIVDIAQCLVDPRLKKGQIDGQSASV
ncbi:MAG: ABC transporter permease subunit [Pseudomonadota bacterium]